MNQCSTLGLHVGNVDRSIEALYVHTFSNCLEVISCNSFDYVPFDYLVIALITWRIKLIVLQVIIL
jgi:hypothetical protein